MGQLPLCPCLQTPIPQPYIYSSKSLPRLGKGSRAIFSLYDRHLMYDRKNDRDLTALTNETFAGVCPLPHAIRKHIYILDLEFVNFYTPFPPNCPFSLPKPVVSHIQRQQEIMKIRLFSCTYNICHCVDAHRA